jgi:hypothetical protein
MSAGHKHSSPNLLIPKPQVLARLHRLLTSGGAPALMRRWQKLDIEHDIPYLLGYNVQGTTAYADRDYINALYDPQYAQQIIGGPVNTGLSPVDTLECTVEHEHVEKVILDADNPVDFYDHDDEPDGWGAHEYATIAEHQKVIQKGGHPAVYERGLSKIIDFCEHKHLEKVPLDLSCSPYLDDPDANEERIIKRMQELGVGDAFKVSKYDVDYGPVHSADRCSTCANWQGLRDRDLAVCRLIAGLVRDDRWCKKFESMGEDNGKATEQEATRGDAEGTGSVQQNLQ